MEIDSYHDVPQDPKELVELIGTIYLGIFASRSFRRYSLKTAAVMLLREAILLAYPDVDDVRVLNYYLDSCESVQSCVQHVESDC